MAAANSGGGLGVGTKTPAHRRVSAVHLGEFYDAADPKCIHAVKWLMDQKFLLSVNQDLMVGVRSNPEKLADIMKELKSVRGMLTRNS